MFSKRRNGEQALDNEIFLPTKPLRATNMSDESSPQLSLSGDPVMGNSSSLLAHWNEECTAV